MTKKTDRRQVRTKLLLRKALLELLARQSADTITVTDIAARADVNRGTFYLHYSDVPDMLEQLQNEVFQHIERSVIRLDPQELSRYAASNAPYPPIIAIFEEIARHADFLKPMLGTYGDLSFAIRLRQMIGAHIFKKLDIILPQTNETAVPRDYLIAYMTSANLGVLLHWLENDMQQTPHQLSVMLTQILNNGPLAAAGLKETSLSAPRKTPE